MQEVYFSPFKTNTMQDVPGKICKLSPGQKFFTFMYMRVLKNHAESIKDGGFFFSRKISK
jgi:hypothetical protein